MYCFEVSLLAHVILKIFKDLETKPWMLLQFSKAETMINIISSERNAPCPAVYSPSLIALPGLTSMQRNCPLTRCPHNLEKATMEN